MVTIRDGLSRLGGVVRRSVVAGCLVGVSLSAFAQVAIPSPPGSDCYMDPSTGGSWCVTSGASPCSSPDAPSSLCSSPSPSSSPSSSSSPVFDDSAIVSSVGGVGMDVGDVGGAILVAVVLVVGFCTVRRFVRS